MVKRGILPTASSMTGRTDRTKLTVVCIFGGMAGVTIPGRTFVNPIDMTGFTLGVGVDTGQWEICFAVIETHIFPTAGVMAGCAIRAELTIMCILLSMTGKTILGCTFENIVHMTGCALYIEMQTCKRESGLGMIEVNILPVSGNMAGATIGPELSLVSIL